MDLSASHGAQGAAPDRSLLRYAAAHGWRANVAMWMVTALSALPGGRKQPRCPGEGAGLHEGVTAAGRCSLALRFGILTAVRSGEVRGARGRNCRSMARHWSIPGERMKGRSVDAHRIRPLTPTPVVWPCLHADRSGGEADRPPAADAADGERADLPDNEKGRPLSDMALSAVMRRMNEQARRRPAPWRDLDGREAVPHGWRATFRTWVDDTRPEDAEAAEKALAHEDRNKVGWCLSAQRSPRPPRPSDGRLGELLRRDRTKDHDAGERRAR